jgi:hypothetical protein|eukprot:COSAG01_NODE_9097_length_2557_cov_5.644426_3_plen_227_part_00
MPATNVISRNFAMANYAANGGCFDNDDGSAWYDITENVCAYGGHKSTNGYGKRTFSNLNIFPQVYGPACAGMFGLPKATATGIYNEGFFNNTCIVLGSDVLHSVDVCVNVSQPTIQHWLRVCRLRRIWHLLQSVGTACDVAAERDRSQVSPYSPQQQVVWQLDSVRRPRRNGPKQLVPCHGRLASAGAGSGDNRHLDASSAFCAHCAAGPPHARDSQAKVAAHPRM